MGAIFEILFYVALGLLILAGYLALALIFCTIGVIYGFGIAVKNYSQAISDNVHFEK